MIKFDYSFKKKAGTKGNGAQRLWHTRHRHAFKD